jgi:hypothetical protein
MTIFSALTSQITLNRICEYNSGTLSSYLLLYSGNTVSFSVAGNIDSFSAAMPSFKLWKWLGSVSHLLSNL